MAPVSDILPSGREFYAGLLALVADLQSSAGAALVASMSLLLSVVVFA